MCFVVGASRLCSDTDVAVVLSDGTGFLLSRHRTPAESNMRSGAELAAPVHKCPILPNADVNRTQLLPLCHAAENLARNIGQQRVGKNVVDVARATLDLCAASR